MDYYVFDTQQKAIDAEAEITVIGLCPLTGINQLTKLPAPAKQKTINWATPLERDTDNKWVIERPPAALRNAILQSVRDQFAIDHPHTVEAFAENWFP